jgi:glycerol-3-phosphate dehydrogenase
MVTITGGKLTTFRRMAKMTVDAIVEREARDAPCRTHEIPLGQAIEPDALPRVEGVPEEAYAMLAGRYGYTAHAVLAIAAERGELAQPIVAGGPPDLLAEVVHAARREQARSVGDALLRRTRLGLLAAEPLTRDTEAARRVASAMAPELGWDARRVEAEADAWLVEARAEGIDAREP